MTLETDEMLITGANLSGDPVMYFYNPMNQEFVHHYTWDKALGADSRGEYWYDSISSSVLLANTYSDNNELPEVTRVALSPTQIDTEIELHANMLNVNSGVIILDQNFENGIEGLGLGEEIDLELYDLILFPNPSNGIINYRINSSKGKADFQIFNLQGQLMESGILKSNQGQLNLDLAPGVYVFEVLIEGEE